MHFSRAIVGINGRVNKEDDMVYLSNLNNNELYSLSNHYCDRKMSYLSLLE